ncbi:MAG: DNA-protecting protein DprA [Candidatus Omnitrophica bacterium]|nr:DNA-protecting protein DprA [Candidatus Omnitrophota bacterium]
MTSQEALMVLNAIPGLAASGIRKLMDAFGSADQILQQNYKTLLEQGLAPSLATNIVHFPKDKFLEGEYNHLRQKDVEVITVVDERYPSCLKAIPSPPLVLYMRGKHQMLSLPAVAMVGSRRASFYGIKIAERFAGVFARVGVAVVSGLAKGIDTASHQGCLKAQGATMAVLGCGLNHIYPKENTRLLEDIAQGGLLVSEFPMDTAPLMYNFPRRNRIISGLSLATLIIEAAEKSGALITADCALEQGRDVFAVPGNIDSDLSQGTNRLIKDGAKIALSAEEILQELGLEMKAQLEQEKSYEKPRVNLSVDEYKVYEMLDHQPNHIDVIAARCGLDIGALMIQVLNLELKGVIKQLPGQYYIRV